MILATLVKEGKMELEVSTVLTLSVTLRKSSLVNYTNNVSSSRR